MASTPVSAAAGSIVAVVFVVVDKMAAVEAVFADKAVVFAVEYILRRVGHSRQDNLVTGVVLEGTRSRPEVGTLKILIEPRSPVWP